MNRLTLPVLLGLACLAASVVGCNNTLQQDFNSLQQQYNDLDQQNKDLSTQLAACTQREATAIQQLDARNMELSSARAQLAQAQTTIAGLQGKPTGSSAGSDAADAGARAGTRTTLSSDVLFTSGRATLTAAGKSEIAKVAANIKSRHAGAKVLVYGYTDSDPIQKTRSLWQDNLDLSANRAMAVTRELIAQGLPAQNIETVAMGASNPLAPNSSAANKAKNRRVEIVVLR